MEIAPPAASDRVRQPWAIGRLIRRGLAPLGEMVVVGDAVSSAAVFIVVSQLRFPDLEWQVWWGQFGVQPWVIVTLWASIWVAVLWYTGSYREQLRLSTRGDIEQVLAAAVIMAAVVFSIFFLTGDYAVSRLLLVALCVVQPLATISLRTLSRRAHSDLRRSGRNTRHALVVGAGPEAQAWADRLERHPELGLRVIGHLRDDGEGMGAVTRPIVGTPDDLDYVLRSHVVDEISICLPADRWSRGVAVASLAREAGKIVRIPLLHAKLAISGGRTDEIDGVEVVTLVYGPNHRVGLALKRVFDVVASILLLVLLSPLLLAVALIVLWQEGRPIFFVQERIGIGGRIFKMVKFRTMVPDAEERLGEVAAMSKISGPAFQVDDDPRVTSSGLRLRRLSLDELPQLWNTLKGDMSIVGPRPAPLVEVDGYDLWHRRRLSMRPGITGLAQVAIRRYVDFDDRARLDLKYIDEWSLRLDARLLVQTVPMVLSGSGR